MVRPCISGVMILLTLSLGWTSASAASYQTIHTHTGFGLLFVLAADQRGNLYVADQKHDAILKLSSAGRLLLKDAMPKQCGISGLAASFAGDVYAVANCPRVNVVYHFTPTGRLLQTFGRQPPGPNGVAVDGSGNVYVTYGSPAGAPPPPPGVHVRTFASRFVEFTANGRALRTVKLPGIHEPWGIIVDYHSSVYVTSVGGLVKVSPIGQITRRWTGVVPAKGKFAPPAQPAVDASSNVYVAGGSGNILKLSSRRQLLSVFVPRGSGPGAVQQPVGLAVSINRVFVGEAGANRIKEFSLSGKLLAVWTP